LLEEVTERLGATKEYTCPIRRKKVFSAMTFGLDDTPLGREKAAAKAAKLAALPDEEMYTGRYLPAKAIPEIEGKIRTGDICLMVRGTVKSKPHLFCDHLGILLRSADCTVQLLHSAAPAVRRDPLRGMCAGPFTAGLRVLRLRPLARTLVAEELSRCGPTIQVATPLAEDQRTLHFRDIRGQQQ